MQGLVVSAVFDMDGVVFAVKRALMGTVATPPEGIRKRNWN